MSANFWKSTHCTNWLIEPSHPNLHHHPKCISHEESWLLKAALSAFIQGVCRRLNLRQRVAATACVYLRRYLFAVQASGEQDLFLVAITCVYVASKVEECGVQATSVLREAKKSDMNHNDHTEKQVVDFEFRLLQALNFDLIVHHPYRSLARYHEDTGAGNDLLQAGWAVVNDVYKSDIPLVYPPHHIALAALYLAADICNVDLTAWFARLDLNLAEVMEVVDKLVHTYELMEAFQRPSISVPAGSPLPQASPVSSASRSPSPPLGVGAVAGAGCVPRQRQYAAVPVLTNILRKLQANAQS